MYLLLYLCIYCKYEDYSLLSYMKTTESIKKNNNFAGVCWSPDSRLLLFSLSTGEVHIYDSLGGFVSKVNSYIFKIHTSRCRREGTLDYILNQQPMFYNNFILLVGSKLVFGLNWLVQAVGV